MKYIYIIFMTMNLIYKYLIHAHAVQENDKLLNF